MRCLQKPLLSQEKLQSLQGHVASVFMTLSVCNVHISMYHARGGDGSQGAATFKPASGSSSAGSPASASTHSPFSTLDLPGQRTMLGCMYLHCAMRMVRLCDLSL